MKKSLLIFILSIIILSCNNIKSNKDSIDFAQKKKQLMEKSLKDSIEYRDSINIEENRKIIGNIKFGMNKSEFKINALDFMNKCKEEKTDYSYELYPDYSKKTAYKLSNYEFCSIYDSYYNDNYLYSITLDGVFIKKDYYETKMKEQVESLYSVIETKYGKPTEDFGFPKYYTLNSDETKELAYWHIGDKLIIMKIRSYGECYCLYLDIFSIKINEKLKLEEKEKKEEDARKGANKL